RERNPIALGSSPRAAALSDFALVVVLPVFFLSMLSVGLIVLSRIIPPPDPRPFDRDEKLLADLRSGKAPASRAVASIERAVKRGRAGEDYRGLIKQTM